jgi:hypothetical protein
MLLLLIVSQSPMESAPIVQTVAAVAATTAPLAPRKFFFDLDEETDTEVRISSLLTRIDLSPSYFPYCI